MIRKGTHKPTIEDAVEISGIEILHPGGYALTKRTAEVCELKPGMRVLDVSSGRGTQAIYYAKEFGCEVVGIDINPNMVSTAQKRAEESGIASSVRFVLGDSQNLPFDDNTFDAVINECAVGIPDNSQKVLDEMIRVVKPKGAIAIHESTWIGKLPSEEKDEISERYGTTPLEFSEWMNMLKRAGTIEIVSELEQWSKPEMFWKIRKDRDVKNYKSVMTVFEKTRTAYRIFKGYGIKGVFKVFQNEKFFYQIVLEQKLGYALFKGIKNPALSKN